MNDSTNTASRSPLVGRAVFVLLFLIPAVLTYFDELTLEILTAMGWESVGVNVSRALPYGLMLLVCAVRSPFVHRWWLPLLPAVAAATDFAIRLQIPSIWLISSILPLIPSLANLITLIAGVAPASSRYQREVKELVDDLVALAPDLRPAEDAEALLAQAEIYATDDDTSDNWQTSRWLIDTRKNTNQQLLIAEECLEKARRLEQLTSADADLLPALSKAYQGIEQATAGPKTKDLLVYFGEHQGAWRTVANAVRRIAMPRVFATEAFFRISERKGIQIASIVTAGLVVLGAVYMTSFYRAAVDIPVHDYWTLDDLFIQGMLVVPYAILALILAEWLFRGMFRYFERARRTAGSLHAYRWLLDRPNAVAALLLAIIVGVVYIAGDVRGESKLRAFYDWEKSQSESATVLDGSVLKDVFLVGTTSRTAIFRRVSNWNDGGNPTREDKRVHHVIIMDRALVVCHARGKICEGLPGRTTTGNDATEKGIKRIEDGLTLLDGKVRNGFGQVLQSVDGLEQDIGLGFKAVDQEFDEVCKHLDRHQRQIVQGVDAAIANLVRGAESPDGDDGTVSGGTIAGTGGHPCPPTDNVPGRA